jgi:hypothetical protein
VSQDQHDVDGRQHDAGARHDGRSSGVVADGGAVVRHRQHRFPARDRVVKARYDEQEYTVLAQAAARAGLTPSGFLAMAGLAAAGQGPGPSQTADRELLAELLSLRTALRRYAVNVNQAVAALHSTGDAPIWLRLAVAGADRAVASADEATTRVARRLS